MDPASSPAVETAVRSTQIICIAIVLSIPIYVVVAWVAAESGTLGSTAGPLSAILVSTLAAFAVSLLLIAQLVWRGMVRAAATKATSAERLGAYRTAAVVAFAVREGTALIGLVLTLLGGNLGWCLGLSALAVLAMLLGWPRRADMLRLASDPETLPIG